MKAPKWAAPICIALAICGCAGNSVRDASGTTAIPPGGKVAKWSVDTNHVDIGGFAREGFISQLRIGFAGLQDEAGAYSVKIEVNEYSMRSGLQQALIGAMGGQDKIVSTVTVCNAATGTDIGWFVVESNNPYITATTANVVEDHAKAITDKLRGK